MNIQNVLACDIGFGYTKFILASVKDNDKEAKVIMQGVFPSAVKRLVTSSFFQIDTHPDYISHQEKSWLVGQTAAQDKKGLRIRSSEFMLEMFPLFLLRVLKEIQPAKPELLIIGTPFQEWLRLREIFTERASEFVSQTECFPQAASAACILGKAAYNALVVDIGFNTCDVVPVDVNGRILSDQGVSWDRLGISALLEDVETLLKSMFSADFTQLQVEDILKSPTRIKKYIPGVDVESFKKKLSRLINEHAHILNARLTDKFDAKKPVVLAGGGSKILAKSWRKHRKVKLLGDPQFANVKGFLLLGLAKNGFQGEILWDEKKEGKSNAGRKQENKTKDEKNISISSENLDKKQDNERASQESEAKTETNKSHGN